MPAWAKIVVIASASLATWIPVALLGPANDPRTLRRFADTVRPPGPAWARYRSAPADPMRPAFARFAGGLVVVFCVLFGTGQLLLGEAWRGWVLLALAFVALQVVLRAGRGVPARRSPEPDPPG